MLFVFYLSAATSSDETKVGDYVRISGDPSDADVVIQVGCRESKSLVDGVEEGTSDPDNEAVDFVQLKYGEAFNEMVQNMDGVQGALMEDIMDEMVTEGQEIVYAKGMDGQEQRAQPVPSEGYADTMNNEQ